MYMKTNVDTCGEGSVGCTLIDKSIRSLPPYLVGTRPGNPLKERIHTREKFRFKSPCVKYPSPQQNMTYA